MKQKICIIDQGELFGGAECYNLDVVKYIPKEEFDVLVLVSKKADKNYLERMSAIPGVEVKKISLYKSQPITVKTVFFSIIVFFQIWVNLLRFHASFVVTNTVRVHIVGSLAAFFAGRPVFWTIHDTTFPYEWLSAFVSIPRKIICVSQYVSEYIKRGVSFVWHDRILEIPNGVDTEVFDQAPPLGLIRDLTGRAFQIEEGKKYVGILGRIDTWKGQHIFLEAVALLKEQGRHYEQCDFLIIGAPTETSEERKEYFESLRRFVEEKRLRNVRFLGFVPGEIILKHLDLLVHASTEAEPFGRVIIEGFEADVPVVASAIGGPEEIIEYGKNGLLFTPGDSRDLAQKITLLLEDKNLRDKVRIQAKADLNSTYAMRVVIDKLLKVWSCDTKSVKSEVNKGQK